MTALWRSLRPAAVLSVLLAIQAGGPLCGAAERPSEEALRAITEKGRRIALYHAAIAAAKERLPQESPEPVASDREVVVERRDGWHVILLKKPDAPTASGRMTMLADARFDTDAGQVTAMRVHAPPRPAPSDAMTRLKALDVAQGAATVRKEAAPPYEQSIFTEEDQGGAMLHVYLKSEPLRPGTLQFGADLLIKVTKDGAQVRSIEALHDAATVLPAPAEATGAPTLHMHDSGDYPTETDVAVVVQNPAIAPHLVMTPHHIFRIEADGTIIWLGPNEPAPPPGGESR